jgi:hypothetical protein
MPRLLKKRNASGWSIWSCRTRNWKSPADHGWQKIIANSPQSIAAYKRLYNSNENMTLDKSLELEFGSEFEITDSLERLSQFAK